MAIDKNSGRTEGLPEIVSRGLAGCDDEGAGILKEARQVVARRIESSTDEEKTDWGVMQGKIRGDLKRYLSKQTARRPLIVPVILEI